MRSPAVGRFDIAKRTRFLFLIYIYFCETILYRAFYERPGFCEFEDKKTEKIKEVARIKMYMNDEEREVQSDYLVKGKWKKGRGAKVGERSWRFYRESTLCNRSAES